MPRIKDIVGYRYGKLTVIKDTGERKKTRTGSSIIWECICDCGVTVFQCTNRLTSGHTKSCGCWNRDKDCKSTTKEQGESNFERLYRTYQRGAKARNHAFELTKDQFLQITKKECFYCGIEPNQIVDEKNTNGSYIYNGIDRIDNNKGYIIDNVLPCCYVCNRAKRDMLYNEFISYLDRIANFRKVIQ